MKASVKFIAVIATILSLGCSGEGERPLRLVGNYATHHSKVVDDGSGVKCLIDISSHECLSLTGLETTSRIDVTYNFGGAIEYRNITLTYEAVTNGEWFATDSSLTLLPDTSTFTATFVGSTAVSSVDEAMVRQLRKMHRSELEMRVKEMMAQPSAGTNTMAIVCKSPNSLIVRWSGKLLLMAKE